MGTYFNAHCSLHSHSASECNFYSAIFIAIQLAALTLVSTNVLAQIQKISPGSRANGMGTAFVAIADDASAVFWNPAGIAISIDSIAQINRRLSLMYSPLYGLSYLQHKFLAYTQDRLLRSSYFGSLGLGIVELDLSPHSDDVQSLNYTEDTFLISWAYSFSLQPFLSRFSIGASFKYYNIRTAKSAFGYGGDLGLLGMQSFNFESWQIDLRLGFIVQDFGGSSLWYRGSFSPALQEFIEPNYRYGIAIGVRRESWGLQHLLLSAEMHRRDKYAMKRTAANLGAEMRVLPGFDLRAGIQDLNKPCYAFGFGVIFPKLDLFGARLAFDAALLTHPELNETRAFTLSLIGGEKQ